jgi:DNA invertase Pin-like site-specific DNA recombinase
MPNDSIQRRRCAVYTRKSSEEGLEQAFNSLDAQREACEAYIQSQAGQGWQLVRTRYDDGGLSGGTLERPGLQQLLADITTGKVDTVVVYKVDRLTRSLADFAKIVEVFDGQGASFVSVTQQFNTTTSMGRLTLNMLLSFAQFEREVTGERIRDKIAASKRKGMWMGGFVPLGYDASERTLVVNEAEAETVRTLYRLYLDLKNVRRVKEEADRLGLVTKIRNAADGKSRGGRPMSRGNIYHLLGNPIYTGHIRHRKQIHEGQHAAIIDPETWDRVQAMLADNAHERRSGAQAAEPSLLAGLIYDHAGARLTPTHAVKGGKRYRYYIAKSDGRVAEGKMSGALRLPAQEIETLVSQALIQMLADQGNLFEVLHLGQCQPGPVKQVLAQAVELAAELKNKNANQRAAITRGLLHRVVVYEGEIETVVCLKKMAKMLGLGNENASGSADHSEEVLHTIRIPVELRRCGRAAKLIIGTGIDMTTPARPDPLLIKAVMRAHDWFGRLVSGQAEGAEDIAEAEGLSRSYVTRVMRLAFLAPDIVEVILDGRQPPRLTADILIRSSRLPLSWSEQRRALGFERH